MDTTAGQSNDNNNSNDDEASSLKLRLEQLQVLETMLRDRIRTMEQEQYNAMLEQSRHVAENQRLKREIEAWQAKAAFSEKANGNGNAYQQQQQQQQQTTTRRRREVSDDSREQQNHVGSSEDEQGQTGLNPVAARAPKSTTRNSSSNKMHKSRVLVPVDMQRKSGHAAASAVASLNMADNGSTNDDDEDDDGSIDESSPHDYEDATTLEPSKRKRGRPKGSTKKKRTKAAKRMKLDSKSDDDSDDDTPEGSPPRVQVESPAPFRKRGRPKGCTGKYKKMTTTASLHAYYHCPVKSCTRSFLFAKKLNPPLNADGTVSDKTYWPSSDFQNHHYTIRNHMRSQHSTEMPQSSWPRGFAIQSDRGFFSKQSSGTKKATAASSSSSSAKEGEDLPSLRALALGLRDRN